MTDNYLSFIIPCMKDIGINLKVSTNRVKKMAKIFINNWKLILLPIKVIINFIFNHLIVCPIQKKENKKKDHY